MKLHYLACTQQNFSCSGHHISGNLIMVIGLAMAAFALTGVIASRRRASRVLPQHTPRRHSISPRTASLLTGTAVRGYWHPVTATTPDGIPVRLNRCCPHGHTTPAASRTCAQAAADRITRTGR